MKKRLLLTSLITLLSLPTFVGCNNTNSSSNLITSNKDEELKTQRATINEMLTKLRKGVTFEGEISQTKHILDGYYGDPTGETQTVLYEGEFIFEKSEENGYSAIVTSKEGDNEKELIINNQVFEGKDGYAYFYDLNYDNTVSKYKIYDMETGSGVNFGYYCLNPFDYLLPEDFSKVEGKENTYTLTKSKAAFFASNVFGQVDNAFNKVIESFEFTLDGSDLKSFTLKPQLNHSQYTDFETFSAVYYFAENIATFNVLNVGTSKVKKVQPKETKDEHANLQEALEKYQDNFTINLEIWYEDEDGENFWENHLWYYYDGESLYFSTNEDQSYHDDVNNMFFQSSTPGGLMSPLNEFTYEEVTPKIDEVDAAVFNYDAENNIYHICDEMVSYFPAIAIVPPISTITLFLDGYNTYFDIKLTNSNEIEYVKFGYFYEDIQFNDIGHATMTFSNVGTTKIPHGLKSYE